MFQVLHTPLLQLLYRSGSWADVTVQEHSIKSSWADVPLQELGWRQLTVSSLACSSHGNVNDPLLCRNRLRDISHFERRIATLEGE